MSKNHRETRKPALADWTVAVYSKGEIIEVAVARSRMVRDSGGYTFTDDKGIVADYPPGTVLSVTRKDPADVWPLNLPAAQPDDAGFLDATADGKAAAK